MPILLEAHLVVNHEYREAVLRLEGLSADQIFGFPDDKKLSCATLFASVSLPDSVFHRLLDKYFQGNGDPMTLRLLA